MIEDAIPMFFILTGGPGGGKTFNTPIPHTYMS
jgi:predicted ATPase